TPDTLFQIASLSKLLTGVVTNSLIRTGELDAEAPIATYLGPVLGEQMSGGLESITTQHLLNHKAGIENDDCSLYAKRQEGEAWLDGYSRAQLLTDLRKLSLPKGAAADFSYSSCGYALVGLIDEIVSDQKFAALLNERVTAKYDMPDTQVELATDQESRLATPYRKDDRRVPTQASDMGMGTPASAVYSSTRDLARLLAAQLAAYREYAASGEETDLILSQQTVQGHREELRFGTGIIELTHEEGTIYLHDGDADGFASLYAFAPEQDVGIVMLTGSGGDIFVETGLELLALMMASENAANKSKM
ncbi:MAG: serine hydrolase domain-containing protein, partial [Pseudomonadota bacterium]